MTPYRDRLNAGHYAPKTPKPQTSVEKQTDPQPPKAAKPKT